MLSNQKFADLTDYCRLIAPCKFEGVKNVGWLDVRAGFAIGKMPEPIIRKLKAIANGNDAIQPLVEPVRRLPACDLCGDVRVLRTDGLPFMESELWIPHGGIFFAAPITILHLIEVHHYLPPADYLSAIVNMDLDEPFDAMRVYQDKLQASGWIDRARARMQA